MVERGKLGGLWIWDLIEGTEKDGILVFSNTVANNQVIFRLF